MKQISLSAIFLFLFLICNSQSLPDEMYFTPDGRQLFTGGRPSTGLFDQSMVRDVRLDFAQPNYWTLLQNNYSSHTDIMATLTIDGNLYDSVGARFKGQTSYSGSGSSQKKSFNITTDY